MSATKQIKHPALVRNFWRKLGFIGCIALMTSMHADAGNSASTPQLLAQQCTTLGNPPQLALTTGAGAAAGSSLLVSIAAASSIISDISVTDGAQSRYFSVGGYHDPSNSFALVVLRAPLERPLPTASQITIQFSDISTGIAGCAQVFVARGVGFSGQVMDTVGAATSGSNQPEPILNSTTPAIAAPELVFATLASSLSPGAADTPAAVLSNLCSPGMCLTGASYTLCSGGQATVSFSANTQGTWVGAIGALYDDDIFGNGFN